MDDMSTIESVNPATGEVIAKFPVQTATDVDRIVHSARVAAQWWAGLGFDGRRRRLADWRSWLTRHMRELAELIHTENGKPTDDALFEVSIAIEHLDWAARHAPKVLGRRAALPGLLTANHTVSVEHLPYGVVGVLGPWNYPVHTPMGSISYALAAGNAVVFKPSEHTTAVGQWLVDSFAAAVPEHAVLSLVTGLGDTGAALCRSDVDKIAFTGSTATGKKVMATCAERLTPVVIECGGNDVLIVADDADLDAAAEAAVWGGMTNGGQTCVGVERVLVADAVFDRFLPKIVERARALRPGSDATADYGPMTMPSQLDVVRRHVTDALDRGARAVVGGADSVGEQYAGPVVLVDVPSDAEIEQEETFAPVLSVSRVADDDAAVARANATPFGLGAAVFSRRRGQGIARRLRCGMVSVNSVVTFAAVPSVPFGGVGDSGFGRIHGADGLREFARPRGMTTLRAPAPIFLQTFRRRRWATPSLVRLVQSRWTGRGPR